MAAMAVASFCSDLTMPISWNTCVEIGKEHTATVSSTMNMLGNFAASSRRWCSASSCSAPTTMDHLIYTMAVAALVSAACWFFLDPERASDRSTAALTSIEAAPQA